MRFNLCTARSNCGILASRSSKAAHSGAVYATRHGSRALVTTMRRSPVASSTSRYRAGTLVRPFASMVCSYRPRNIDAPSPLYGLDVVVWHFLPRFPTTKDDAMEGGLQCQYFS